MADDAEAAADDEPVSLTELVAAYRQQLPILHMAVAQTSHELRQKIEHIPDLQVRDAMKKQILLWDVYSAQLGALPVMLQMLWELYTAMGCNVEQRRDN